jgi:uncharacterized protein (DUF4415 family)
MISDEPDEDADKLDDENLLKTYLAVGLPKVDQEAEPMVPDWPPTTTRELGLNVDADTLRWFETNYGDWRQGMCSVLRAWVAVHSRDAPTTGGTTSGGSTTGMKPPQV